MKLDRCLLRIGPHNGMNFVEQQLRFLITVLGILTFLAWIVTFYFTSVNH